MEIARSIKDKLALVKYPLHRLLIGLSVDGLLLLGRLVYPSRGLHSNYKRLVFGVLAAELMIGYAVVSKPLVWSLVWGIFFSVVAIIYSFKLILGKKKALTDERTVPL